jgi:uncharacterized protein YcbX
MLCAVKPPICAVCHVRFDPSSGGGLVSFRKSSADKGWYERAKKPGFVGHPPHQAWFCATHRAAAEALSSRTRASALASIAESALRPRRVTRVTGLYRYPLKSCAAESLERASLGPLGISEDRRWMLVDEQGRFLTGREHPALVLVRVVVHADGATFSMPDGRSVSVRHAAMNVPVSTLVWKDAITGLAGSREADEAFSAYLKTPCRLLWLGGAAGGRVRAKEPRAGLEVGFADGFPLLLLSAESVAAVSALAPRPFTALHFRPNILVEGAEAFAEDSWGAFRVGEVELEVVNRCARCVFTTVDPASGRKSEDREPLVTLAEHRRFDNDACLGVNAVVRRGGVVRVGDELQLV